MKKNNYNWNLNPDNLSPEEIAKHKDFDALLNQVTPTAEQTPQRAPLTRRFYYIGGAVAAALIGLLFYTTGFGTETAPVVSFDDYAAELPYVNPPIDNIQKAFNSQSIDVNKGGVYEYDNGSKVTVPAGAFTDRYGNLAVGQVDIKYKEYHDYVDFFLSGIPLEYDSAGTKYFLESAGMIEIYAEQNGERLEMTPGKELDVELVSTINMKKGGPIPSFNIYSLDTEARNWVYEGIDLINLAEEPASNLLSDEEVEIEQEKKTQLKGLERKEQQQLAVIENSLPKPAKPFKPMKKNGTDLAFNFDIAADKIKYGNDVPTEAQAGIRSAERDLMKLKQEYGNTVWQVAPDNGPYEKQAVAGITWDDMIMRHLQNQDYELKLIKGDQSVLLKVNPVLNGTDYEAALAKFNEEQAVYLNKIAARTASLNQKKAVLKAEIDAERAILDQEFEDRLASLRANGQAHRATDELIQVKVINSFTATSLGIWNCDRPIPPSIYTLNSDFKGKDNSKFDGNIAYLVNKQRNSVARFYTQKGTRLQFNQDSDNLLWLVTDENKFAIYPPEEFKKINTKNGDHTFVMNVDNRKIETEDDIRAVLNF